MKKRILIGTETLDRAIELYEKHVPVATIVKVLELDKPLHYRTAFNIITADKQGSKATRPPWLKPEPYVQEAPDGWKLVNGIFKGYWEYNEPN